MKYLIRLLGLIGLCLLLVCFAAAAEVPEETGIPEAAEEAVLPAPEAEEAPALRRKMSESVFSNVDVSYYVISGKGTNSDNEFLRDIQPDLDYVGVTLALKKGIVTVREGKNPVIIMDFGNAGTTYFVIRSERLGLYRIDVIHTNHCDSSRSYSIENAILYLRDESIAFTSVDYKQSIRISWSVKGQKKQALQKELMEMLVVLDDLHTQKGAVYKPSMPEAHSPAEAQKPDDPLASAQAPAESSASEPVTNEVSVCYRSEDGTPLWTLTVRGSFRAEHDGFICTDAAGELAIFDDSWSKASLEFYPDGSVAVGNLKMQRSALGIVVGTKELRFVVGANSD